MEQWSELRWRVLVEGVSKRQVLRETGMHWSTLEKMLAHPEPPGYRRTREHPRPKLGPYLGRIEAILAADEEVRLVKQRHTAQGIFERLREEGYTGGYTQVKAAVRELRQHRREVFLPLVHRPGEAQMDVGEALAQGGGGDCQGTQRPRPEGAAGAGAGAEKGGSSGRVENEGAREAPAPRSRVGGGGWREYGEGTRPFIRGWCPARSGREGC